MTPSEIEPATFRLVAQYLNQLRYNVPPPLHHAMKIYGGDDWFHVLVTVHYAYLIGARWAQEPVWSLENITVLPCQESLHFSDHPPCSLVEVTAELLWCVI